MKNLKVLILINVVVFIASCNTQEYYNVPTNADGEVVITDISKTTSDGITMLDNEFTVTATLPNATSGDEIKTEVLKLQVPPQGGDEQLLPLEGTQKKFTVGGDKKVSVTYTRSEAKLNNVGDYVLVTFGGETSSAQMRIDMEKAVSASNPMYAGESVTVTRNAGTAYFTVNVEPSTGNYTGSIIVKEKNGLNAAWQPVGQGSFQTGDDVPIVSNDFAANQDTMYYSFVAQKGSFSDSLTKQVIISSPSFFVQRSGTLSFSDSTQGGGLNLLTGNAVGKNDMDATISVSNDSLIIKGGSNWETGGKSISFVSSSTSMFSKNNSSDAIAAYNSGTVIKDANPNNGSGVYIFKLDNGSGSQDPFYGILSVSNIKPGVSVDIDYRIGTLYSQISTLQ